MQNDFRAVGTQVLGVSVDSHHCHLNWARDLGGVSFPLLADFHPKGKLAQELGLYIDAAGISDRATVIIDKSGVVQYANSVTPMGKRDIGALLEEAKRVNNGAVGADAFQKPEGIPGDAVLYVRSNCGPSRRAKAARETLRLSSLAMKNVSEDAAAMTELEKVSGGKTAPCLVVGGKPMLEAKDIIGAMANRVAPVG